MLNAVAGDAELAEPLGRGASTKGQVRARLTVLMLPSAKLLGELTGISEDRSAIELVFIGAVAPFTKLAAAGCRSPKLRPGSLGERPCSAEGLQDAGDWEEAGVAGALWLSALLRRTRFSVEDRIAAGKK